MADTSIYVLLVALITWGGVFLYLLRLAALAKRLETELKAHAAQIEESQKTESQIEDSQKMKPSPLSSS